MRNQKKFEYHSYGFNHTAKFAEGLSSCEIPHYVVNLADITGSSKKWPAKSETPVAAPPAKKRRTNKNEQILGWEKKELFPVEDFCPDEASPLWLTSNKNFFEQY